MANNTNKESEPWYVYIIRCVDNTLYTGITKDLTRRFAEHQNDNNKGAKYFRGKQPLQLVFHTTVADRSTATQLEAYIKSLNKSQKELMKFNFNGKQFNNNLL